jgi:protein-S-isoprenylcysteine O-methyltransferase Ste14
VTKRSLVRLVIGLLLYPGLLFGTAGTWAWPEAWAFLFIHGAATWWLMTWLRRYDPALLAERLKGMIQEGQPLWDRVLLVAFSVSWLLWLAVPGMDVRFAWSRVPIGLELLGGGLLLLGWWGIIATHRANTFLAPVVRIQRERDHRVIDTGPYAIVRHPMYAAFLAWTPGSALLLGSWVALALTPLVVLPLIVRTALEDAVLARELDGYEAYRERVRYRLVPGVW